MQTWDVAKSLHDFRKFSQPPVAYGLTLRLDILDSRSELMTRGASGGLIERVNERASEQGSTRNINKNTCKEKPSDNKDTGLNKKTYKCFLTVAMKLSRV